MDKKVCPECNFEIIGRKDKKFCSDQCRNTYNNRLNKDPNKHIRRINRILRKNRRILEGSISRGVEEMQHAELRALGFDFLYYTHTKKGKSAAVIYYCYDYGYSIRKDGRVVLVF